MCISWPDLHTAGAYLVEAPTFLVARNEASVTLIICMSAKHFSESDLVRNPIFSLQHLTSLQSPSNRNTRLPGVDFNRHSVAHRIAGI